MRVGWGGVFHGAHYASAPPCGLVQLVDQELHRSGLLPRGGRLLVAVSGGADSVGVPAAASLCAINGSEYWGWKLVVGHVDHGIRGAASAADAKFVRALARELGLPCVSRRFEVGEGGERGCAARKVRIKCVWSDGAGEEHAAAVVPAHSCG